MQLSSDKGSMSSPPSFRFGCAKERSRFLCERGVDEHAGRYRMTFFHENRRFRLVVEEEGNAIQRSTEISATINFPLRREARLARMLLLLANFGKEGRPEPIIAKISQETLAEMIGTTRSRVSFFMNKFRELGVLLITTATLKFTVPC